MKNNADDKITLDTTTPVVTIIDDDPAVPTHLQITTYVTDPDPDYVP